MWLTSFLGVIAGFYALRTKSGLHCHWCLVQDSFGENLHPIVAHSLKDCAICNWLDGVEDDSLWTDYTTEISYDNVSDIDDLHSDTYE